MNKQQEIMEHYSAIIDELIDDSNFFKAYFQRPYMLEEEYSEDGVMVVTGAARCCSIDDDSDYVIKLDIEEDALGSACEREEAIYTAAKAAHLDQYFAAVTYLGLYERTIYWYDIEDIERRMSWYSIEEFEEEFEQACQRLKRHTIKISIPLYGYEFAADYNSTMKDVKISERTTIERVGSPLRSSCSDVAIAFLREYGFEEYKRFSRFGLEWHMNDIHRGNIGTINQRLVLLDYAGYHDDDIYDDDDPNTIWWEKGTDDEVEEEEDNDTDY